MLQCSQDEGFPNTLILLSHFLQIGEVPPFLQFKVAYLHSFFQNCDSKTTNYNLRGLLKFGSTVCAFDHREISSAFLMQKKSLFINFTVFFNKTTNFNRFSPCFSSKLWILTIFLTSLPCKVADQQTILQKDDDCNI